MSELVEYVQKNVTRVPAGSDASATNVVFFSVVASNAADAQALRALISGHKGQFESVDPFDGEEHSYIEIGAWVGSQGVALELIGLGTQLGLWRLLSPRTVLGDSVTAEQEQQLAGQGLVSLQYVPPKVTH